MTEIQSKFNIRPRDPEAERPVRLTINGRQVEMEPGSTILEAARKAAVHIPTLCYMKLEDFDICNDVSACRVCLVDVEGMPRLVTSCSEKVRDGMNVRTDTPRAVQGRRTSMELLLSNHPPACLTCAKNLECELQEVSYQMGIREVSYEGKRMSHPIDSSSRAIIKEPDKCIMCRRCETMCNEVQTVGVLSALNRGFDTVVGSAFHLDLNETSCTFCGQCVAVCPTGALTEMNETMKVWRALHNPRKHVVVQVAPAVRVAIGELFGREPGEIMTGELVSALRMMGFDAVFDTDWGADLTVIEEASELVERLQGHGRLPILTSCCPAWVSFIETQFPDMLDIPSSCRSPQTMTGAMIKSYYAAKNNLNADDIVVVSIMPCLAKKAEAARPELSKDENMNVDVVVSTRELGSMLHQLGIDLSQLPEDSFDTLLGISSGASVIFGTTGGVIEATVRTAAEWLTGEELENVEFSQLRGFEGVRTAEVAIGDRVLQIGIAHGLGNARKMLEAIRSGVLELDAIEIMACPGGCIGGGGQPYHHGDADVLRKRREGLYTADRSMKIRKAHENPMIAQIYEEYLGEPYGELAHDLLHTEYTARRRI